MTPPPEHTFVEGQLKSRRAVRQAVLQALYATAVSGALPELVIERVLKEGQAEGEAKDFAEKMFFGVTERFQELDAILSRHLASNWHIDRIAMIDLTVLRMAVLELYHANAIPPRVTINEAVGLAKKFGTAESGRFVNGVLGSVFHECPKADWDDRPPVSEEKDSLPEAVPDDAPSEPVVEEFDQEVAAPAEEEHGFRWSVSSPEPGNNA